MKHNISMQSGGHNWEKQNLVTLQGFRGERNHDILKCSGCGLEGKSYTLGMITIDGRKSTGQVNKCSAYVPEVKGRIKITKCQAVGKVFSNLTPESEHDIIPAPAPYTDKPDGVWVMGVGEPVKVLNYEFIKLP